MNKTMVFLCALGLALGSSVGLADEASPHRTIQVTGQGKASAVPDMASISTGVVTQGKSAADAMNENNQIVEKLIKELTDMQVAERDIQTSQFNVQPEYERGPRGERKPEIVGYRVSNQLRIRVRNLDSMGKLLDRLIQAGSNQISGISFGVDDQDKVMNLARIDSMKDARERAELFARVAGLKVGKVITISEQQIAFPRPNYVGVAMESRSAGVPIASGEQDFSATINVTFELVENQ
jgi:uncharacterized protein YggE